MIVTLIGCTDTPAGIEYIGTTEAEVTDTTEATYVEDPVTTGPIFLASNYTGEPYIVVNDNKPSFNKDDIHGAMLDGACLETYDSLDRLGRCGTAYACICKNTLPTEERGAIGSVKPTGWHTVKYPELIKDLYLYNRCHLIAYCLAGENANELNLITGTRYLNIEGMLPFETDIAQYLDANPDNHVLYRVTPIFEGDNLIAEGVWLEAYSCEDDGAGICFSVFCFNVQPGIHIDYATGESWVEGNDSNTEESEYNADSLQGEREFILNLNSKKIHIDGCSAIESMSEQNRADVITVYESLLEEGYEPCGICHPEQ